MQRAQTQVERLVLPRRAPVVPCAYAEGRGELWKRRISSCGALIPFAPTSACPVCGQRQVRAHAPKPGPDAVIIDRDVAIIDADTGEVVVAYVVAAESIASRLAAGLRHVRWDSDIYTAVNTTTRLSGMAVTHVTFGYQPPQPVRRRYGCSRSQFNSTYPEAMDALADFCRLAEHTFRIQAPDVYDRTAKAVHETIAPAWRIAGTPWSSGIINQTAALPYHRDRSNIPKSWSAMLGCRSGVDGGLLHLVDYDVHLAVAHGSISIFDGQSVTHGVTPLHMAKPHAYRYTAVTYAKSAMGVCCPDPTQEVRRAAIAATVDEDKRAAAGYKAGKRRS
jgi:Oxygenase domain of the 2OGFeDO superfamily